MQSWPGIVHGGCLVALVDAATERLGGGAGPRRIEGRLTSSVPIETALDLETGRSDDIISLSIRHEGQTLTSGGVTALGKRAVIRSVARQRRRLSFPRRTCVSRCGAQNPLGLQTTLAFDAEGVWVRLQPRAPWRAGGDRLHPAMAPVLLDEVSGGSAPSS